MKALNEKLTKEAAAPNKNVAKKMRRKLQKGDLYKVGDLLVNGRFEINEKLGQGGFGQVFKVFDSKTEKCLAMKIENLEPGGASMELTVLRAVQGYPHCPLLYVSGVVDGNSYICMQLLGRNLSSIRRDCAYSPNRLSIHSAYRSTIQCIRALEELHNKGFIHRDVKPSNFATGFEFDARGQIFIFDFGLCSSIFHMDGRHKAKRPDGQCGFRGTVRYASLATHNKSDLSRRDDLWQLFYQFIEVLSGILPWRLVNDKDKVAHMKRKFAPEAFCQVLPFPVGDFVAHVRGLGFEDRPDYDYLVKCLQKCTEIEKLTEKDEPFDWQADDCYWLRHWKPPNY